MCVCDILSDILLNKSSFMKIEDFNLFFVICILRSRYGEIRVLIKVDLTIKLGISTS